MTLVSGNDGETLEIRKNFAEFISLLKKTDKLQNLIANPLIKIKKKSLILEKISVKLKFSKKFRGFLLIMTKHGKLPYVEKNFHYLFEDNTDPEIKTTFTKLFLDIIQTYKYQSV